MGVRERAFRAGRDDLAAMVLAGGEAGQQPGGERDPPEADGNGGAQRRRPRL
jgi:hypothetical protein